MNRELDHVKALLNKGKPDAAEEHLLRIKGDHGTSLTLQQQFRLQAYFGQVFHDRGEASKASVHFRNASNLRPADEEGQAHGVLSDFMGGNADIAYRRASELLERHPASSLATAVLVRSAPRDVKAAALEARVNNAVKEEVDVLAALARRFLSEEDAATAERYARRALAKRPDHPSVVGNVGIAIVVGEANAAGRRFWQGPLTEGVRRRLEEAVSLLTTAMAATRSPDEARQFRSMRAVARELLGNQTEAEADHVAALEADPVNEDVALRYVLFLGRNDRPMEALAVFRPVVHKPVATETALLFARLALEHGTEADKQNAVSCLRRGIGRLSEATVHHRANASNFLVFSRHFLHLVCDIGTWMC